MPGGLIARWPGPCPQGEAAEGRKSRWDFRRAGFARPRIRVFGVPARPAAWGIERYRAVIAAVIAKLGIRK